MSETKRCNFDNKRTANSPGTISRYHTKCGLGGFLAPALDPAFAVPATPLTPTPFEVDPARDGGTVPECGRGRGAVKWRDRSCERKVG